MGKIVNVQAVINNISFPKSVAELRHFAYEVGRFDVEDILHNSETEWTMPKWAMPNDIVFFFHAKTAIDIIRRLEIEIEREKPEDGVILLYWLQRARALYGEFGGKIYAVGRVLHRPFYDDFADNEGLHWKGKIYAAIGDICVLENPIDISEFSDFIFVSRQSAITAVLGEDFEKLKKVILRKNTLPAYVVKSRATPMPLKDISPLNWLQVTRSYRRSFFLEVQFRRYYVDYFLKYIGDTKKIFSECACYRDGSLTGYADNCIRIDGKLCVVEVKLNISAENKLEEQLEQYCYIDEISLEKDRIPADRLIHDRALVIDTEKLYIYDAGSKTFTEITDLDSLEKNEDLPTVRKYIIQCLSESW